MFSPKVFTDILNISISATLLIAVCFLVRTVFRKMPKYIRCLMWLLVFVRLAIPFSIESNLSVLPTKEYIVTEVISEEVSEAEPGKVSENSEEFSYTFVQMKNESITDSSMNRGVKPGFMSVLSVVWMAGALAAFLYAFVAYLVLRCRVRDAVILRDNIYQSEKIDTAFVLGIIRPRIYIPYGLTGTNLDMILEHENAHIARRDHLVKPLGFLIAAVYWFNPAVWFAYVMLCRDIELACDEKVIGIIGFEMKKSYSQALLDMSVPRHLITACPVAFGEIGTDERVKNVLNMKKTKIIVAAVAFVLCGAIGIGFLTYPKKNSEVETAQVDIEEVTELTTEAETEAVDKEDTATETVSETTSKAISISSEFEINVPDDAEVVADGDHRMLVWTDETNGKRDVILYKIDSTEQEDAVIEIGGTMLDEGSSYKITLEDNGNLNADDGVFICNVCLENSETNGKTIYIEKQGGLYYSNVDGAVIYWPLKGETPSSGAVDDDNAEYTVLELEEECSIFTAKSGTVIEVGYDQDFEKYCIEILGDDGYTYIYGGLDENKIKVAKGDKITAGSELGNLAVPDGTGSPLFSFAVKNENGEYVDPASLYGDN